MTDVLLRAWIGLWSACLFGGAVALTGLYIRQRRARGSVLSLPIGLTAYLIYQYASVMNTGAEYHAPVQAFMRRADGIPAVVRIAFLLLLTGIEILMSAEIRWYGKKRITPTSVKEAMDALPLGLCFYSDVGRIYLGNEAARDFCRAVTGENLLNGRAFADVLFTGTLGEGWKRSVIHGSTILLLPGGLALQPEVKRLSPGLWLLTIADITEPYSRIEELKRSMREVAALNRRLEAYNREIVALTVDNEILAAKVKIHDALGADLLIIRRYLLNGEGDRSDIADRLRRNISFLKAPPEEVPDEYGRIMKTAEDIGVRLELRGVLPEEEPNKHVIATALHECLTNTIRHARGDLLTAEIGEGEDCISAVFTNNGDPPKGPVRASGGLASLKTLTEKAGGSMTIRTDPRFSVEIKLPKGGKTWRTEY